MNVRPRGNIGRQSGSYLWIKRTEVKRQHSFLSQPDLTVKSLII